MSFRARFLKCILDSQGMTVIPWWLIGAIVLLLAFCLSLSGCSTFDVAFKDKPSLEYVSVRVVWDTSRCLPSQLACVDRPGRFNGDLVTMYLPMPASFTDEKVCSVGHETLHALGARHE